PDALPDAARLPFGKAAPAGDLAAIGSWQIAPAAAFAQDIEDAIERPPVIHAWPPDPTLRRDRQQGADALPLLVAEQRRCRLLLARVDRAGDRAPHLHQPSP